MRKDAQRNRERILAAAEVVFGRNGAAGSTEEVARRAGVGIATVFRHFPTKEALIEAALLAHFARLTARACLLAESPDAGASLGELVREMVSAGATKLTLASAAGEISDLSPAVREASDRLRDAVAEVLESAQRSGAAAERVTVDEVYLLIRALAQASVTLPVDAETLRRSIDIVVAGVVTGQRPSS